MKDSKILLLHIMESVGHIEEFSERVTFKAFSKDRMRQSAIIRELEIIGEAAKNLPSDFRKKHPEIPWQEIAGMRDKLVHHYFGINLERVWEVLKKDLPGLKEKIGKIL